MIKLSEIKGFGQKNVSKSHILGPTTQREFAGFVIQLDKSSESCLKMLISPDFTYSMIISRALSWLWWLSIFSWARGKIKNKNRKLKVEGCKT